MTRPAVASPGAETHVREILQTLLTLPPEGIAQVHDFALFLQQRYGLTRPIDSSDSWSEQDVHDLLAATWAYAELALGPEEPTHAPAR